MKKILIWTTTIIGFIGMVLLLRFVLFPVNTLNRGIDTAYEVVDQTMTGANAIYNYEWFKKQYHSIEALRQKEKRSIEDVENFRELLSNDRNDWGREDKIEYDRLNSISTGLSNQLNDSIAIYNARSEMVNRAIFKDDLPTNITRAVIDGFTLTK